jgi:hypothetical protein
MDWMKEFKRRVASFPSDVQNAHKHSSNNRAELIRSNLCGCFYCCSIFTPNQIESWVNSPKGKEQMALCPKCGIDSVIGDAAGFEISQEFLKKMKTYWF